MAGGSRFGLLGPWRRCDFNRALFAYTPLTAARTGTKGPQNQEPTDPRTRWRPRKKGLRRRLRVRPVEPKVPGSLDTRQTTPPKGHPAIGTPAGTALPRRGPCASAYHLPLERLPYLQGVGARTPITPCRSLPSPPFDGWRNDTLGTASSFLIIRRPRKAFQSSPAWFRALKSAPQEVDPSKPVWTVTRGNSVYQDEAVGPDRTVTFPSDTKEHEARTRVHAGSGGGARRSIVGALPRSRDSLFFMSGPISTIRQVRLLCAGGGP